jgi:hypothetical protein
MKAHLLLAFLLSAAAAIAGVACSENEITLAKLCPVSLNIGTMFVSAAATSGSMNVTPAANCAWSAASSAGFLTITSGASGTGNGVVNYSIAANTGVARAASIAVNGSIANFGQSAPFAPNECAVTLSTTNVKINSGGGSATVDVTAPSACNWNAGTSSPFLSVAAKQTAIGSLAIAVTPQAGGQPLPPPPPQMGNGTVTIAAAPNSGPSRSGTVSIGGQTVTVTQDAAN